MTQKNYLLLALIFTSVLGLNSALLASDGAKSLSETGVKWSQFLVNAMNDDSKEAQKTIEEFKNLRDRKIESITFYYKSTVAPEPSYTRSFLIRSTDEDSDIIQSLSVGKKVVRGDEVEFLEPRVLTSE